MNIRRLQTEDALLMLEWMHDPDVVKDLQGNFAEKTMDDCLAFIKAAEETSANLHLAVVDEQDSYMGTISLRSICDKSAELAIVVRHCAMGKGYSRYAMDHIFRVGFEKYALDAIYWCVSPENHRAVRYYDKNEFSRMDAEEFYPGMKRYTAEQIQGYLWYCVKK